MCGTYFIDNRHCQIEPQKMRNCVQNTQFDCIVHDPRKDVCTTVLGLKIKVKQVGH